MKNIVPRNAKPRVGIISIHPAPYRDPTFAAVHDRGFVDLQVFTMFEQDSGHAYWNLGKPPYTNRFLGKSIWLGRRSSFQPEIVSHLRKGRFDVVIVPGYNHVTSLVAFLYCFITKTPVVFNTDATLLTPDSTTNRLTRNAIVQQIVNRAAAMWVPGSASRLYAEYYGMSQDLIFEGAYCLDNNYINRALQDTRNFRHSLRERLGISKKDFVFLMVANFTENRRHLLLLDSFRQVIDEAPNTKLVLIGSGPEQNRIEAMCRQLFSGQVKLVAPVPFAELTDWYRICDAYVHPGWEPYSTALAHAAIVGRPIVSSNDVGAAMDFVIDGVTGFITLGGDNLAMKQAMQQLCQNPQNAILMGSESKRFAEYRSVEWAAKQLESAVQTAIEIAITRRSV